MGEEVKILRVVKPKEGGVLTYVEGHPYPFPGLPLSRMVRKSALIKALFPAIIKGAKYVIEKDKCDPKLFSKPVREVYRLFNILIEREKSDRMKEMWANMRDVVCYILEFDSAYRFRLQDVLPEIDLDAIKPDEATEYFMSLNPSYNWGGGKIAKKFKNKKCQSKKGGKK